MLMLALALQARLSSSSRQAPQFWTSATLTSNACDTVGWRTPSPNRGCAEPTDAPAPGVKTHLSRREREQPSWPLQSSQLARYLSCPHRKDRDANPGARECPHVLRSWCYIPCSCHRTGTTADPDLNSPWLSPHPSNSWTCMPWTEGSRLALNTCSCVQRSYSPSLYSGIPSLSCSLSHLPTSQCTYTYMSLLRYQQQATDSRTAGPPRCLTGQGHRRLELHAVWQFLHMHRSWPHCLMLTNVPACSHASANMPEQQDGHRPAEGDPPKQQRSRFRPDGRRRRTSGEIAKRAPHAQTGRTSRPGTDNVSTREPHRPTIGKLTSHSTSGSIMTKAKRIKGSRMTTAPGVAKKTTVPGMADDQ